MDRSEILTLYTSAYSSDSYGIQQATETSRDVFCDVSSVSMNEWTEGGRIGLNPELRFTMFSHDYANENVCSYKGVRYYIYRTYLGRNDTIELYVERRQG